LTGGMVIERVYPAQELEAVSVRPEFR
jgi:hypothetical protein